MNLVRGTRPVNQFFEILSRWPTSWSTLPSGRRVVGSRSLRPAYRTLGLPGRVVRKAVARPVTGDPRSIDLLAVLTAAGDPLGGCAVASRCRCALSKGSGV